MNKCSLLEYDWKLASSELSLDNREWAYKFSAEQ